MTPKPILNPTREESRLYQLQADWRFSNDDGKQAIAEEIKRHPEWAILISDDRPIATELHQTPQKSNLSRIIGENNTSTLSQNQAP